jgi:hypothetical protein
VKGHSHPWAIVAPWWKWPQPLTSVSGRMTRPAIQKYETSKLVDEFIGNPQKHLKWVDEDLVHIVQPAAPVPKGINGRPRRFSDLEYVIDPLRTRKIFLDTHKRFYLVVCQIHCDAPGFPRASRADVCRVGFVVRRRTTDIPPAGTRQAGAILKRISAARTKLGVLNAQATVAKKKLTTLAGQATVGGAATGSAPAFATALMTEAVVASTDRQRASTRALLQLERSRLLEWTKNFKVVPRLQGWFNDPSLEKVGAWADVEEKPGALNGEAVFPMYPLIPPQGDEEHSGRFGTIYFGLLPTGTGETDTKANPRFDDQQYYEVTCFAERHLVPHDRGSPCHCPGSLFWSLPSAPYRLASHFDVAGTSKRPVTVQLPDLDELAAQAAPAFGVAFAKPAKSLMVTGNGKGEMKKLGRTKLPEICSFSIPLITIVASFVFELFLPVVMLAFGLWFLLKLKFCILPEVEVAAGVTAELALDASLAVEANLSASIDASIENVFGPGKPHDSPETLAALRNEFSPIATANMEVALVAAASGGGPDLTDGIEFEAEVAHP